MCVWLVELAKASIDAMSHKKIEYESGSSLLSALGHTLYTNGRPAGEALNYGRRPTNGWRFNEVKEVKGSATSLRIHSGCRFRLEFHELFT